MKRVYILLLLPLFLGCVEDPEGKSELVAASNTETVFEADKWKVKVGGDYPYRDKMLEDLMNSRQIVGDKGLRDLEREQILELLGEPDRIDTNYLFYRVEQMRLGLWPIHTKTMVIELSENNQVNWVKIHE